MAHALVEVFERLAGNLFAVLFDPLQKEHLAEVRAREAPPIRCPRSGSASWVKRGKRPRQLKTSRGRCRFPLPEISSQAYGRTWSSFLKRLRLEPHQRMSDALRHQLTELATEINYQKVRRLGERTLGATLSAMTIWRAVKRRGKEVEYTTGREGDRLLAVNGTRLPLSPKTRGKAVHLAFSVSERGH